MKKNIEAKSCTVPAIDAELASGKGPVSSLILDPKRSGESADNLALWRAAVERRGGDVLEGGAGKELPGFVKLPFAAILELPDLFIVKGYDQVCFTINIEEKEPWEKLKDIVSKVRSIKANWGG